MLCKCCIQYASKLGKRSSGHGTGKSQFSSQSQRKAMPKNLQTIALISNTSKVILKILQARLQQYMNCEISDVQAGFRKERRTRDKLPTSIGSSKKQESSRKTSVLLTMPKPLTVWITINCGKFWKRWQYQTTSWASLLRNLYAGQEATVRTGHGTTDWFQIRKVVCQGCILSPCLLNLYAEYIMQNARLDEAQVRIKIAEKYP